MRSLALRHLMLLLCVLTISLGDASAADPKPAWVATKIIPAAEARQAAAADEDFVYAIDNAVIAKYDRRTGRRAAFSQGAAHHLNSGFIHDGRMYCAHSNYPQLPEQSAIKSLDLSTMQLTDYKTFEESPHGSLTWAVLEQNAWWCVFARYGADNADTVLVKYDLQWNEQGVWRFPGSVVADLGKHSISGGLWWHGKLLATGHDNRVMYELAVPDQSGELIHTGTIPVPFRGQGIAADPVTGGLIGIRRKEREMVIACPPAVP